MKTFRAIVILALIAVIGIFGFSYSRNPDLSPTIHAEAVGFVLAKPFSVGSWQGLACPHRSVVTDLVTKSLAPKMCGTPSDGGAADRAARFQTDGPESCWELYNALSERAESRFADIIAKKAEPTPASQDICRKATKLLQAS